MFFGEADCHSQCAHWLRNDRFFGKGCEARPGGRGRTPPLRVARKLVQAGDRESRPYGGIARSAVQVYAAGCGHPALRVHSKECSTGLGGAGSAYWRFYHSFPLTSSYKRPAPLQQEGRREDSHDSISYFLALLSTTSRSRAVKSSRDMAPRSPSVRCRGETVPFSMSRSPTTTM